MTDTGIADNEPHVNSSETIERRRVVAVRLQNSVDSALATAGSVVDSHVDSLRRRHPEAPEQELVKRLGTEFLSAVTATGAATGGAAAVPGAGTAAALALTAGDASWFLTAAASYVLSTLRVHGYAIDDLEHQKAVVLAVLAGGGGSGFVGKAAQRTGGHLGKLLTREVPVSTIRTANKVLGYNFITKYGTKQGILVIGKAAPFGFGMAIGAGGNHLMARSIIRTTHKALEVAQQIY